MNLVRASSYMFADKQWPRKFGLILLVSPVPVIGQLWAMGYANLCLRRFAKGEGDQELPEVNLGWELCWLGIRVLLVTLICSIAVTLLALPLFVGQETSAETITPAIVQAFQGPSALLVSIASTVVTGAVLLRFALTGSFLGGFSLPNLWALLRAEPAIWITYSLVGFVLTEGPYGLVWVLPLHGALDAVATVAATSVLWAFGLMINTHLIGQAFAWSRRTAELRKAAVGYQR